MEKCHGRRTDGLRHSYGGPAPGGGRTYSELAASEPLTVQLPDCCWHIAGGVQFDKSESFRIAGHSVANYFDRRDDMAVLLKPPPQFDFTQPVRDIAYKQSHS
jgi:hypothetical protein